MPFLGYQPGTTRWRASRRHQDEILAPLRGVEKVNGKAVDVVQFEENVNAWKPVEK